MTFVLESVKVGERINSCNAEVGKIGLLLLFLCVAVKKKRARRFCCCLCGKKQGPVRAVAAVGWSLREWTLKHGKRSFVQTMARGFMEKLLFPDSQTLMSIP